MAEVVKRDSLGRVKLYWRFFYNPLNVFLLGPGADALHAPKPHPCRATQSRRLAYPCQQFVAGIG